MFDALLPGEHTADKYTHTHRQTAKPHAFFQSETEVHKRKCRQIQYVWAWHGGSAATVCAQNVTQWQRRQRRWRQQRHRRLQHNQTNFDAGWGSTGPTNICMHTHICTHTCVHIYTTKYKTYICLMLVVVAVIVAFQNVVNFVDAVAVGVSKLFLLSLKTCFTWSKRRRRRSASASPALLLLLTHTERSAHTAHTHTHICIYIRMYAYKIAFAYFLFGILLLLMLLLKTFFFFFKYT